MKTIEEISHIAVSDCVDIYCDFSEPEVNKMAPSIQRAWATGARLVARQKWLDENEAD